MLLLYSWRFSRCSAPVHWLVHGHMTSNNENFPPNAMSGRHCEIYDVKRETVHCYPRNVDLLTAVTRDQRQPDVVAGISAGRFSKFAFVLFCYITDYLMTGPQGNSEFCFPRISIFPSTSFRETLGFSVNKIHCSHRDHHQVLNSVQGTQMGKSNRQNSFLL